jgi:two-component system CheB/CheR fusion protein
VELSPQVVWFAGADGAITFCNQRWLDSTGLSFKQSKGDGWAEAIPAEHRERILHEWHKAVHSGDDFEMEVPFLTREGTVRWHLARGTPVRDKHDRIERWIGVALDIHDRKKAEHSLREADRNKTEFLAMLAHELRNPLAAIRSAVQLCREDPAHETCSWALDIVERQGGQLTRLVDDLLDVSRITMGLIRLHPQCVDASVILDQTVESLRPLISQRHHDLILAYDRSGSALPLKADPARLEQIIGNLLTNAAKYTPDGGRIELSARVDEQTSNAPGNTRHILISVRDNGMGMPQEKLKEMFELFTQGAHGRERSEGGLGIGLAIVKRLTEMHGGTVTAHSEGPGRGSEFTLCLPLLEVEDSTPEAEQSSEEAHLHLPGSQRVLVVDDNTDVAESMARLLRRRGYTVEIAFNGPDGLVKARAFRPALLLLDIGLPGMDGYELATELRQDDSFRAAVFIAISGYGQEDDRRRSREAGFDYHLTKPVNFSELLQLLASPKRSAS